MRPLTGFNRKRLSSDQCTLCHDLIFHPIWSHAHGSKAILWHIVSSGRFIGLLSRSCALSRRLLTRPSANALIDNPSALQRVCSAEWLLSSEPFKESIFSWSRFQRLICSLAFFYTPGLVHVLLQSNNDQVAYIESFSSLSVGHTTPYHSNPCHLSAFHIFQRAMLK